MHDLLTTPGAELLLPAILEQQAFVFCDPAEWEEIEPLLSDEDAVVARVSFAGPEGQGECLFGAALSLGRQIASTLLELMPDDPQLEPLARDSLQEVANVVAGHLVTHCLGDMQRYRIEAPVVELWDAPRWHQKIRSTSAQRYLADELPVWVEAVLHSPAAAT